MKNKYNAIIFLTLISLAFQVHSQDFNPSYTARYRVTFEADWSNNTHPTDFPSGAHFSPVVGLTHRNLGAIWQSGRLASDGIELMAELGSISTISNEINALINNGEAEFLLQGPGSGAPDSTEFEFSISQTYPLVSLVSMIAPSPDWFVGINGVNLRENGQWMEQLSLELPAYDAGSDDGLRFTSGDMESSPAQTISRINESPFANNIPLGKFVFELLDTSNNFPIAAYHSGLYYDPERSGEGINLIISEQDERHIAAINWYTYHNNQQFWLVGSTEFQPGIDSLTIDVFSTSSTGFGASFNTDDVQTIPWGTITLSFPACDKVIMDYNSTDNDFGSGTQELVRLLAVGQLNCQ